MAETIGGVIAELDEIIADARRQASRLGFFPSLYRRVTLEVWESIERGDFEDGPRMERFDVVFANLYLDAYRAHVAGRSTSVAWAVAFEATGDWQPVVLQHLLLGMNAHINLDLGIAAARVAPGAALPALRTDYLRINDLLESLIDDVQDQLAEVMPGLRLLDRIAGRADERFVDFSMRSARGHSWRHATELAPLSVVEQAPYIAALDVRVAEMGRRIWRPSCLKRLALMPVRLGEPRSVSESIDALA